MRNPTDSEVTSITDLEICTSQRLGLIGDGTFFRSAETWQPSLPFMDEVMVASSSVLYGRTNGRKLVHPQGQTDELSDARLSGRRIWTEDDYSGFSLHITTPFVIAYVLM